MKPPGLVKIQSILIFSGGNLNQKANSSGFGRCCFLGFAFVNGLFAFLNGIFGIEVVHEVFQRFH